MAKRFRLIISRHIEVGQHTNTIDWIIRLYRDGGHSQDVIASIVGLSQPRVCQILSRARQSDPDLAKCDKRKRAVNSEPLRRPMVTPASQMGSTDRPGNLDLM